MSPNRQAIRRDRVARVWLERLHRVHVSACLFGYSSPAAFARRDLLLRRQNNALVIGTCPAWTPISLQQDRGFRVDEPSRCGHGTPAWVAATGWRKSAGLFRRGCIQGNVGLTFLLLVPARCHAPWTSIALSMNDLACETIVVHRAEYDTVNLGRAVWRWLVGGVTWRIYWRKCKKTAIQMVDQLSSTWSSSRDVWSVQMRQNACVTTCTIVAAKRPTQSWTSYSPPPRAFAFGAALGSGAAAFAAAAFSTLAFCTFQPACASECVSESNSQARVKTTSLLLCALRLPLLVVTWRPAPKDRGAGGTYDIRLALSLMVAKAKWNCATIISATASPLRLLSRVFVNGHWRAVSTNRLLEGAASPAAFTVRLSNINCTHTHTHTHTSLKTWALLGAGSMRAMKWAHGRGNGPLRLHEWN